MKPKREIISLDTFEISNYIGATFINITPTKESNIGIVIGKNQSHAAKGDYRIQYTRDEIFKSKIQDGYYFLGRYSILENSSFSLRYFSSDSTLEFLHDWHCNIPNDEPYFLTILPTKYMWFATELSNKFTQDSNRSYFDSIPDFSWNNTSYKMEIDTTFINRKIVVDTINSKPEYRILKQYLERPKELILDSRNNSIFILLTKMKDSAFFQYKLVPWVEYTGDHIKWENGAAGNNAVEIKNIPIGTYLLYIKDSLSGKVSDGYKITVLPRWYQTIVFKTILGFLALGTIAFLLFLNYKKRAKQKLAKAERKRAELDMQMRSIYAQLNPHFIFNALSSIQRLVSSHQYESANTYLVSFSKLLRKPLDESALLYWTIQDEIDLLTEYIKLEQLRTPFHYAILIPDTIKSENVRFPAMLLQPLVENAVKHSGIESQKLTINISFESSGHKLLVGVSDNGIGIKDAAFGKGLKLTHEYIQFVKQKFPYSNANIDVNSNDSGTNILITLDHWIDYE